MRKVWIVSDAIISPLGLTSAENYEHVANGQSGICLTADKAFTTDPMYASAIKGFSVQQGFSKIEVLALQAARETLRNYQPDKSRTLFIFSTTKGNIDSPLDPKVQPRIALHACAQYIASQLGLTHNLVVSNACISGVLAMVTAQRYLSSGKFDHALVVGADVLSRFVVSGFKSLYALSNAPCKPFDKHRDGLTLGEAAAAMLITARPQDFGVTPSIEVLGGAVTNDANHISGPSRTGKELALAITNALQNTDRKASQIDFISAHGTATVYNDEMEAKAFHLAGLTNVPLNSLKGYFGHTLGAAGVVEAVITSHSLLKDELIPTLGCSESGVSSKINITIKKQAHFMKTVLKTASGFGGCNAAVLMEKLIDNK
ncbi:MAG TPA: beta-ketoacyl synthase N-terminal-like domain-containing protein [Ohtaekwangia sp.]|nr:beta-ketoacyl synthase N-terminal-like domain-containing protein [Ohtaekwangia sp.]